MIYESLRLIREELGTYIELQNAGLNNITRDDVVMGNVATIEGPNQDILQSKIIISLVNVEEESALKNSPYYQRTPGGVRLQNPPVHLNLYLLFCANFSSETDSYQLALQQLSFVIQFFQGNNIFTVNTSPNSTIAVDPDNPDLTELRLMLDLYTLTFEQINHLWGALGGKQIPFVMYKARLVKVLDRRTLAGGEVVREVHSSEEIQ